MSAATNRLSLQEFQADPQAAFEAAARTGEPIALTVDGTVRAVLTAPTAADLSRSENLPTLEDRDEAGLLAGLDAADADVRAGEALPFEAFAAETRAKYGL